MRVVECELAKCGQLAFDVHLQDLVPPGYEDDTEEPEDVVGLPADYAAKIEGQSAGGASGRT